MARIYPAGAIVGVRAAIAADDNVQPALIRLAAYGHKGLGEFQTDD
ncbi:hypothetical protein [Stenotrophomonas sp. YAU14D1_LEIMI4_1]|nr:hypothetical protein [Stenotrophomonas sp. YAU14D1_LEIMI4_1]